MMLASMKQKFNCCSSEAVCGMRAVSWEATLQCLHVQSLCLLDPASGSALEHAVQNVAAILHQERHRSSGMLLPHHMLGQSDAHGFRSPAALPPVLNQPAASGSGGSRRLTVSSGGIARKRLFC